MSTRQYIGARYVPKFFDWDGSPEWRSGVAYEPLTIVTRNGNSYTSKIPVPSNIGVPESNPTYWVATGLYNEQLESIRELALEVQSDLGDEVNNREEADTTLNAAIESEAQTRESADSALDADLSAETQAREAAIEAEAQARENADSALSDAIDTEAQTRAENDTKLANLIEDIRSQNRKFVFLGDSYNATAHYSWGEKIITALGLTVGVNAWNHAMPGAGFGTAVSNNFYLGLQTIRSGMTDEQAESVTDVVIAGGLNDYQASAEAIRTGFENCQTYVKAQFPHARYHVVCCGWGYENDNERTGVLMAYNIYKEVNKYARIYDKAYAIFLVRNCLDTDMAHPTNTGAVRLARSIINLINGGDYYFFQYTNTSCTFDSLVIKADITPYGINLSNVLVSRINLTTPVNMNAASPVTIATQTNGAANNVFMRECRFMGTAVMQTSDNSFHQMPVLIRVLKQTNALAWDLQVATRNLTNGDWALNSVKALYLFFNATVPIYEV